MMNNGNTWMDDGGGSPGTIGWLLRQQGLEAKKAAQAAAAVHVSSIYQLGGAGIVGDDGTTADYIRPVANPVFSTGNIYSSLTSSTNTADYGASTPASLTGTGGVLTGTSATTASGYNWTLIALIGGGLFLLWSAFK
jgi:hypothetical protein